MWQSCRSVNLQFSFLEYTHFQLNYGMNLHHSRIEHLWQLFLLLRSYGVNFGRMWMALEEGMAKGGSCNEVTTFRSPHASNGSGNLEKAELLLMYLAMLGILQ